MMGAEMIQVNAEMIQMICNIILIVIGAFTLISALIGLKKGLISSLVSLVLWGTMFAIIFGFNMKFTELYFGIDLTGILGNFNVTSFEVNGTLISLEQNIGGVIEDLMVVFGLEEATSATTALAMSVLSFFVLIIHLILCLILVPILKLIIYNLILKPLVTKVMKKKKLRLAGFFVNGLKTALVTVVFLTPLFTLTENLVHSFEAGLQENYEYNENESNNVWNVIYPSVDGYNNSLLHKFFSVITGSGTNNGYCTATVNNDKHTEVNFLDIIDSAASVGVAFLSTAEDLSQASITTAILADHTLEVFSDQILSSAFLMGEVLPIALTIGVEMLTNMEDSIIDAETGDLIAAEIGDIDFSADLTSYIELFRILNREGLVTGVIMETGTFDYELSRENQELLDEALISFKEDQDAIKNDPEKTTILDVVLPPVLSSLVKNATTDELPLDQMLPSTPDGYRSLDVIELLQVVSDVIFNINDLYLNAVSFYPSANLLDKQSIKTQGREVSNLSFATLNKLVENGNLLRTLFCEENVFDGVSDSRDETATKKIATIDLFAGNDQDKGLFDISFLIENFPNVIDYALTTFTSGENASFQLDDSVIEDVNQLISSYDEKEDWVNEIDALLNCVGLIFDNADLPVFLLDDAGNIYSEPNIAIEDASTQAAIKELCDYIDYSTIIVNVFPSILKSTLDISTIPLLADYGVTMDDFNFEEFTSGSTLGSEIKDLIDAFGILLDMDFNDNFLTSDSIDSDDLYHAFEYMIDCEIINPEIEDHSTNILRKVILGLMNSEDMENIGLSLDEDLYDEKLDNGTLLEELRNICDIMDVIKESDGLTNMINSNEGVSISDIQGEDIENLVAALAKSDFLRPSLSSVIEKQLSPAFDDMGIDSNYLNYDSMSDADEQIWTEEGQKLAAIIDEINVLTNGNVENVDWMDIVTNEEKRSNVKRLFTSLQSLHFLEGEYLEGNVVYDRFGLVIYNLLEQSLTDYINDDNREQIKKDFSFAYYQDYYQRNIDDENIVMTSGQTRNELWENEIDILLDVFTNLTPLLEDSDEGSTLQITIDEHSINDVINLLVGVEEVGQDRVYGINDLTIFRTILSSILDTTVGDGSSLNFDGFDMSNAYIHTDVFKPGFELNFETGADFKSFALEDNYIDQNKATLSYRDAEILLRKNEISSLLGALKDILNLGEFSTDSISSWVNDNVLGNLLSDLHDSLIMHTPEIAIQKDKLTAFERVIDIILESSISSMIYENSDEHVAVIQKITRSEMNGGDITWNNPLDGEITKLSNALQDIESLKTEDGQDTPLKKFVLGASDAPDTLGLDILNENADKNELEIIIKSLSISNLINPSEDIDARYANNSCLGKLFDDNLGESLSDIGMEHHSFKETDLFNNDWDKEAETLSILVNNIKDITRNPDGTYKDITEIDYSDYSSLELLINSMYDIPSIQAVYEETQHASSFGDFVYFAISDSYLTNDKITQAEKDQVKMDIYEVESIGNTDIWKTNEGVIGEISKLIDLIKISGEDGYGVLLDGVVVNSNFTSIYKGVNGDNGNTLPGVAMLRDMNDITFLRTVLSSLVRTELQTVEFALGSFDTNKIYAPLFSDIINKDVNMNLSRVEEKLERKNELDHLVEITEYTIELDGLLSGDVEFSAIENDVDSIIEMLDVMETSSFFHNGFYGIDRSTTETTFFEDVMLEVLRNSASEFIYENDEDEMVDVILAISNGKNSLSWNKNIDGELYRLKDAIKTISLLKDESGEDTELRKIIIGTSSEELSLTSINNNNYAGNENNEIELLLKSFSKSNLLNPSISVATKYENESLLGKAFDTKVGTSINDLGMDNHSFARVDRFENDWDKEAETLSIVVNEIKNVTTDDLNDIEWAEIEHDTLKSLFKSVYEVPSIAANYGTTELDYDNSIYEKSSYEDLINHVIDVSFNEDSDNDGVGDTFSSENIIDIEFDIYSVGTTYKWFTDNELNDLPETNLGQTNKFIELLESASSRGYGVIDDGKFVVDNFTTYSENKDGYGVEILYELNDIYFLRTVFASLMENSFLDSSGFDVGGLDMEKVYSGVFAEVLNYKEENSLFINDRDNELLQRSKEIDHLVEVVEYSDEINDILSDSSASLDSFEDEDIKTAFDLLGTLKDSRLFHVGRYKASGTYNTTFFEDAVMLVMDDANIDDLVYDSEKDVAFGSKEAKIATYIKNISFMNVFDEDLDMDGLLGDNEYRTWDKELVSLENSFINISNIEGLVNDSGEIIVNDLATSDCKIALNNLNASYLTQDALGNTMKTIYDEIGIDDFQVDRNELDRAPDYYLDNIISIDFEDSMIKWNTEIENICETKDVFGDSISDFDFSVADQNIAGILSVTSESNIMKPMFSDFIYSIFEEAGIEENISRIADSGNDTYENYINTYTGELADAKYRRDTIDFLSEQKILSWEYEGAVLDNMIHQMNELSSLDVNDASESVAYSVNDLFASVYDYSGADYNYNEFVDSPNNIVATSQIIEETLYTRGYLASELMLNFLDSKLNTSELHVKYFENIRFDYSYVCFNDYEREALEYIILLAAHFNEFTSIDELILEFDATYSKHLGPGEALTSPKRDVGYVLLDDGWNSNVALQMLHSNYLEGIINERFDVSISSVFTSENKPIEYAAHNEWAENLTLAIYGF